ncbi:PAS domain-containing protein [Candidatus Binatia bacterium]|nr:PAS domain-containing protein [Candidatus Binatia bacterium]
MHEPGAAADGYGTRELLAQRVRAMCWVLLCSLALFTVRDLLVGGPALVPLLLLKGFQIGLVVGLLYVVVREIWPYRMLALTVAVSVLLAFSTAVAGVFRNDLGTWPLLYVAYIMVTATMFPWGPLPQAIVGLSGLLALAANVYGVQGHFGLGTAPVAAVLAAFGISVYVAAEFERYREALDERYRELEESEQRQSAVVRAVPVTLHRADVRAGRVGAVWLSDNVERVTGFSRGELLRPGAVAFWESRLHPDERDRVRRQLIDMLKHGAVSLEHRWRCADGDYRWFLYQGVVRRGADGSAAEVVGSWLDITERKRVEQTLAESEERLQLALRGSKDGVWDWDMASGSVYFSPRWTAMLGYEPEDLVGTIRTWEGLIHPDDAEQVRATWRGHMAGDVPSYEAEYRLRTKAGAWRWVRVRGQVMARSPEGRPLRATGTLEDIHERKRMEEELQRAKAAAESANRAKSQFLANMSHEIRTPMNAIIGMTDLTLDTQLTAEQHAYLEMVRSSADSLLRVINDILDFSKIEAGKLSLEYVPFHLAHHLDTTLQPLGVRASQKGVALVWDVHPDVPSELVGDPGRLCQVVVNLVGNAIKFTEQGEVTLRVDVADAQLPAGPAPPGAEETGFALGDAYAWRTLHFSVRDTGLGISEHQQERIFSPFEQADASTTRRHGGTGLGLSISWQLVRMMGGYMWVESQPGQGSTFHFVLPFAVAPAHEGATPDVSRTSEVDADRQARGDGASADGLRILLAEDNFTNQQVVLSLLEKRGHRVTVASDGHEVLKALARAQFDVVLMDVQMPGLDGMEAAAAIRANEARNGGHVPIVAVTAHAMSGDADRFLAAGMDAYLAKPIDSRRLFEVLDRLTGRPENAVGGRQA